MQTASIHETKTKLSSLIKLVEQSNELILFTKHGHPVAERGPVSRKSRLLVDPLLAGIQINCDPVEPTEDEWLPAS
jgi:antitoxin (DNA-binding transcriptional repressor) of toxin-antitoxin stability system